MKILKEIYSSWKILAHKIGVFQSRIILTVFYFILMLPLGIIFGFFKDELGIKSKKNKGWEDFERNMNTLEEMRRQY